MDTKYIESLRLIDAVIAVRQDATAINPAFDELLTYLHTNFGAPPAHNSDEYNKELEVLRKVFFHECEYKIEEIIFSNQTVVSEVLWPILVVRYVLIDQIAPISPKHLKMFNEYHKRYGCLVLDIGGKKDRQDSYATGS